MYDNSIGACRKCGAKIPPAYYRTTCHGCGELLPAPTLRRLPAAACVTPEILRRAEEAYPEEGWSETAHPRDTETAGTVSSPATTAWVDDPPVLTMVFRGLAALEMLGGIVLCMAFWPGTPELGYTWKAVAYATALTWLMAGFIFGFLFLAIGEALLYLRDIRSRLRSLTSVSPPSQS